MRDSLNANDSVNPVGGEDEFRTKTDDANSGSTHGSAFVSSNTALVDKLVEMITSSPTPELVLVDVLWKVKTTKSFDRVGHTAMEWFTDLPRTNSAAVH